MSVEVGEGEKAQKVEYRVWNPFRSKLAASILAGVDHIHIRPGCKVLYLGAASGTSVSHVSDIVGPEGAVYAVEFSHRSGAWPPSLPLVAFPLSLSRYLRACDSIMTVPPVYVSFVDKILRFPVTLSVRIL